MVAVCPSHMGVSYIWGYPKIVGLKWQIPLKLMIWGYPYFRKPPYVSFSFPTSTMVWEFYLEGIRFLKQLPECWIVLNGVCVVHQTTQHLPTKILEDGNFIPFLVGMHNDLYCIILGFSWWMDNHTTYTVQTCPNNSANEHSKHFKGLGGLHLLHPLVMTNSSLLNMAHLVRWFTELKDGDFPVRYVAVYQRVNHI